MRQKVSLGLSKFWRVCCQTLVPNTYVPFDPCLDMTTAIVAITKTTNISIPPMIKACLHRYGIVVVIDFNVLPLSFSILRVYYVICFWWQRKQCFVASKSSVILYQNIYLRHVFRFLSSKLRTWLSRASEGVSCEKSAILFFNLPSTPHIMFSPGWKVLWQKGVKVHPVLLYCGEYLAVTSCNVSFTITSLQCFVLANN